MKENKINKLMLFGLLIVGLINLASMLIEIRVAIVCFVTGLGMSLFLFGVYALNNDMAKIKQLKNKTIKRFTS